MKDLKFEISLIGLNHERAYAKYKASTTYTFAISHGPAKTHADVIFWDGGIEVIEEKGKSSKTAARLALQRLLSAGCDPFEDQIFIQIPYRQAEFFSKYGNFRQRFPSV